MVWWLFHSLNPCYTDSVVVINRSCEKAVLYQVIKTAKQKQLLLFLGWWGLLPMQAFKHCLLGKRDGDTAFVTALYEIVFL